MDYYMIIHTDKYLLYTYRVGKYFFHCKFSIVVAPPEKRWIFNAFNTDSQLYLFHLKRIEYLILSIQILNYIHFA